MKRKFQAGDEVMSRGVCDLWSAAVVTGYHKNGYYLVRDKNCPHMSPYLQHASNLRKPAKQAVKPVGGKTDSAYLLAMIGQEAQALAAAASTRDRKTVTAVYRRLSGFAGEYLKGRR